MNRGVTMALLAVAALWGSQVQAQNSLSTAEARDHIGKAATVCGDVVSVRYAAKTRGTPTFLNLDKPYPNQVFTVLIWGDDRAKFGNPEQKYREQRICVTGKITDYKGIPEVIATEPSQIRIESRQ